MIVDTISSELKWRDSLPVVAVPSRPGGVLASEVESMI